LAGDVLGFWNSGGIFLSPVGIVRDGRIGKQGKDLRAMQYLALMLQDIEKWNGERWVSDSETSFGMPGPEPEWLSGICIAYITLRGGSLCTQ
jgi:hypothetical protein